MARCEQLGFRLAAVRIVTDKRWFGRYWFLIFRKGWAGGCDFSWTVPPYTDGPLPSEGKPSLGETEIE